MKWLLTVTCLLLTSCAQPEAPATEQDAEPLPDYVQGVQGDGYRGVIFTSDRAVVPGIEEQGTVDLTPHWALPDGAAFRRATEAEVATFEAALPTHWDRYMVECPNDDCPLAPATSHLLRGLRRQYFGYTDAAGGRGLWVFFYPEAEYDSFSVEGYSSWVLMPERVLEEGPPSFFNLLYSVDRDSVLSIWSDAPA
jgi:hypothetical protein